MVRDHHQIIIIANAKTKAIPFEFELKVLSFFPHERQQLKIADAANVKVNSHLAFSIELL